MGIKIGNIDASYFKVGSGDCSIYLGDTKLWPTAPSAPKFYATYLDGTDYTVQCNGSSTLTQSEVRSGVTSYNGSFTAMTTANVGDCVTSISAQAFYYCSSLSAVTLSDNIVSIGNYGFMSCVNIENINIPTGITTINYATFSSCYKLKSIEIPSGVTTIGDVAFAQCYSLSSITIPNTVTNIGNSAFSSCSGLTTITIPNSVTTIGNYVLSNCIGLTSVNLPDTLASIPRETFSGCLNLQSITIPSGVTNIGQFAFSTCRNLSSIAIPSGITNIETYAFYNCSGLTSITVNATTPPTLGTNVFNNTNNCPIYVPCESVDAYKSATNWSTYASRIQGIPPCTSKQWVSYYEADSVPNYGVYGIKFQSSANHEYVEYPSYIQFVDENNNYINIYYDGGDWHLETSSGAEEITFDYETDYATIIFDDYGVGAATIDEMALLSTGMPFDMQLYELN